MGTPSDVIAGLHNNDPAALKEILHTFRNEMYTRGLWYKLYEDEIEDIILDTIQAVWINRARFKNYNHLKGFMFKTFNNKALNQLRHGQRQKAGRNEYGLYLLYQQATDEENEVMEYYLSRIPAWLDKLTEMQREVVILYIMKDLSALEVSKKLDISVNSVYVHNKNAVDALREIIANELKSGGDGRILPLILLAVLTMIK